MGMGVKIFPGLKKFFTISLPAIILVLLLSNPPPVYCRSSPKRDCGTKYIRNYSRKEYKNQSQNWSVIQDRRGIIYIGNNGGIMQYDGVSWKEIPIANKIALSLARDDKGVIYVGGMNEIGYLEPDDNRSLQYISLIHHLDEQYRNFSYVWRTHWTEEGIYFCTTKFLFLWNSKEVKVWKTERSFAPPFLCGGKLYTRQEGTGLLEMNNGALELIPGGEEFSDKKIYMMVQLQPGKLLIGTRSNGFYLYDKEKATPFETNVLNFIKNKNLSYGIRLSSGDFALATLTGGLAVIDHHGHLKYIFDKSSGLNDDCVRYIFEDSQGNLWLALNEGAAKIEYASPFSFYNERSHLPGFVLAITRHGPDNLVYAGTNKGLYTLVPGGKFRPVPVIPGTCYYLLSIGDSLLAATTHGVFQVRDKNKIKKKITEIPSYFIHHSKIDPMRAWVGTAKGLVSLYLEEGQWEKEGQWENITQEIRTIVEDKKGNLWLGTLPKGVLKADFPAPGTINDPVVTPYDISNHLPTGKIHVFRAAGHVMFATGKGIFRFDEKNKVFIPDFTFGNEFAGGEKGRGVFRIAADKNKNIWIHSRARNIQAIPQPDGIFVLNKKPFLRIPLVHVDTIYPDPSGDITWFASNDGLLRYDTRLKKNYDLAFQTLIRKVWINEKLVFDGYKSDNKPGTHGPIIPFKDRNLRFAFAAPFFEGESETLYQCLLEGYDDNWTAWKKETWKDYTNVDPGLNTFRVRARNVYGNVSREDSFQFKVLPPWYNTWWAYSLYVLAGLLMVFLVVKWRSWKLVQEKQKLEQIINERTREIKEKNQQLQEQSEKLKELDKVKARFFANISHEFRTPLTLIMGPLEQMISDSHEKKQENKLQMMLRNSQRLLGLINQLLELSKFDSGKIKLEASPHELVSFLKGIAASFEVLANQRELDLTFHAEAEDIPVYIDAVKMEEVIGNLLANAVKFTPAGGRITLAVTISKALTDTKAGDFVEISVSDTGTGIPREQLAHIFDRFYQADSTYEHHRKGSGIGLAIAKEVVELHYGTIGVHSRVGENSGTEFVIRLPMGKDHLKPDEIVEPGVPGVPGVPADVKADVRADVPDVPADNRAGAPAEAAPGAEGKDTILVVEDSADVRDYIRGSLEPLYSVAEAKNGREGIEKAQELIPDLIISDIMMPEKDGYELCRVLKNDRMTSHVPIILLTAKVSEESIIEGLETGADDYIAKPFSTRILCVRIKNLIDLRRHLQDTLNREMTFQPAKISVSAIDKEFLHDLQAVIDENISDPDFSVEELSKKLYMGRTTLYRKIQALSGESPTDFIRSYRLKRGAELLKKNFGSVLEVAFEVGFSSANYFTKCFKKKFNQLPTTFKETESS